MKQNKTVLFFFFLKINTMTNISLEQLRGKKEKTQITNVRNERKNNIIDLIDIERKIRRNY